MSLFDSGLKPMFSEPTARQTDPATSHLAARAVRPNTNRERALVALNRAGPAGLTDFELADRTGIAQTSIGVRRKELQRAWLVEATGVRRPSPSGALAQVWAVTDLGRRFAAGLS